MRNPNCQSKLTDSLSPPERSGIVTTQLSHAFHHFLLNTPGGTFSIPEKALPHLVTPDPTTYQNATAHYTVGQTLQLQDLSRSLVVAGFARGRKNLAPGSFRVLGEAIEILHPIFPAPLQLTLHGSILESITVTENRQRKLLQRCTIPPVAFPPKTIPLAEAIKNRGDIYLEPPGALSQERARELIGELAVGKPAVHADHGIGIYEGLQTKHVGDRQREYLVLQYARGDILYIPVEFAHKISAYVGAGTPGLHRLGGTIWSKTKRRAKEDAANFAHELLAISGQRQHARRAPYFVSPALEANLEESFPYTLTPDQAQTWQEVRQDLTSGKPLDRLVVGDVGFGKTEIAIRAAAHAIANHKQVAVLAPTTLLVQQHADIFESRLKMKVCVMSRLAPRMRGDVGPLAIGTHALLSPKIKWQNLGLVIIDEEQKFGVRQKEHFKKLRGEVDVLSLSATPIPRTLAMALSGLRDLSLIQTPPPERRSIQTHVALRVDELLKTAIERELQRGGQVYLVASKIRYLAFLAKHIQTIVPQAKIAIAHGRLPAPRLAHIIHQFDTGEVDILVSSNIVENGLDLPNVNTMIVWNATDFGLADLYQLRGRVGRRARQGYAYFLYDQQELTVPQRERLAALIEAGRLGAGWSVARRDLEIRGAGNLLGRQQSGPANEVGVQLYLDLVNQAAQEKIEKPNIEKPNVEIFLPLTALLPTTYIPDTSARAQWYQRLARSDSLEKIQHHQMQLEQAYGPLPEAAHNLVLLIKLQSTAQDQGITKIDSQRITPPGQSAFWRITLYSQTTTTLETPAINPGFIKNLTHTLQSKHGR